jgi:hypothetical protein
VSGSTDIPQTGSVAAAEEVVSESEIGRGAVMIDPERAE